MGLINVTMGEDGTVLQGPLRLTSAVLTTPTITGATSIATVNTLTTDSAITLASGINVLAKASAGAYTIAAPGTAGLRIQFTTSTAFAHVVTFTGSTLVNGTTGAKITWTSAAFPGSSLVVVSISATQWNVEAQVLGTVA